jgi:hypothetical protein
MLSFSARPCCTRRKQPRIIPLAPHSTHTGLQARAAAQAGGLPLEFPTMPVSDGKTIDFIWRVLNWDGDKTRFAKQQSPASSAAPTDISRSHADLETGRGSRPKSAVYLMTGERRKYLCGVME